MNRTQIVVVSMSHQAIASLALKFRLKIQDAAEKLSSFFSSLGVDYVFDLSLSRHISLIESIREFSQNWSSDASKSNLPIFNSVCPGWICYVEKTHPQLVPFLSHVKSPQQIMGSIVKNLWSKDQMISGGQSVYHVSIMPCYDKKLEASRSYFMDDVTGDPDVNVVLTPIEIEILLNQEAVVLNSLKARKLDVIHDAWRHEKIMSHLGSGSGGYTENVLRVASEKLLSKRLSASEPLEYKMRRNPDFLEIEMSNSCDTLKFAILNGFKNIQTLVQRMKRNDYQKCHYDFIEIMACPKGCLNGGAQIRLSTDQTFDSIETLYRELETCHVPLDESRDQMKVIYDDWFPDDQTIQKYLYTEFKAVPKTENLLTINW